MRLSALGFQTARLAAQLDEATLGGAAVRSQSAARGSQPLPPRIIGLDAAPQRRRTVAAAPAAERVEE